MITRKFLLAALTLLAIIFTPSCKDDDMEYVSMNVETKNISVGEEYQFFVTVSSTSNSTYSGSVKWTVSDASIATIDQNGKVVGKKESTEGVIVKATLDNGRYAIAYLYVGSRSVASADSVTVSRQLMYMNSLDIDTVKVWIAGAYSDANKYPLEAVMSKMNEDGTTVEYDENDPSTWVGTTVEIYTLEDYESQFGTTTPSTPGDEGEGEGEGEEEETTTATNGKTYVLRFTASNVDELAACTVTVGDLSKTIQLHVDFALYFSFNTIDPNNFNLSEISTEKPLEVKVNGTGNMQFNFYVVDSDNLQASIALVESEITSPSNYKISGSLSITLGTPQITQNSNGSYTLTVPVKAGQVAGSGTIRLTAFGKSITSNLTVDDGKTYKAVYISFATPNTYTIPPTEMVLTKSLQAFKSEENATPNTVTIRVYHYVDPDTSAPYINWEQSQSGDPVLIPIGSDPQNLYTDFEYEVGTSTGVSVVTFSVYNPQGEQGGEFSEWLNQSISATVTVLDKADVEVNSVTFNPDFVSTVAATLPLEAVMEPATSSSTWPIQYRVASTENGAEANITSSEDENGNLAYSLNIVKAGTIKVVAEAGPEGNKKSDELTVSAKLQLDVVNYSEPLVITNCPTSLKLGQTGNVVKVLYANYSVSEDQYKWVSSDEEVVEVDGAGKLTAVGTGTATIRVEIKDDFNIYASATRTITVSSLDINANLDDPRFDEYYVISSNGTEFWVDMEEDGASAGNYYTFNLNTDILSNDGVYTAGTDFTGTVKFPDGTQCDITSGTITVSGGNVTFDLTVTFETSTGTITGTKPLLP